jgi:hypothetical protein
VQPIKKSTRLKTMSANENRNLQHKPLIEFLMDFPENELRTVAQEHAIAGLLAQFENMFSETSTKVEFLKQRQQQMQKSILLLDEFSTLQQQFNKKFAQPLTPLKGLSLLKKIYALGERALTDMDVYTNVLPQDFESFFKNMGYTIKQEKKWHFNQHKWVFTKSSPLIEFVLEVHTQLLPQDLEWKWSVNAAGELAADEEFLYLTAHWAQQHTCLKLFWLLDLYFFAQKQKVFINTELINKARKLQIESSLAAAAVALEANFDLVIADSDWKKTQNPLLAYLMRPSSLTYLYRDRFRYLLLKHLLKDRFYQSLSYDLLWVKHQIDKKVSKYKNTFSKDL